MQQDRHFIVEGGKYGSPSCRKAKVTIRMNGSEPVLEVRPHRSREVYMRSLSDIAEGVVERGLAGGDSITQPRRRRRG